MTSTAAEARPGILARARRLRAQVAASRHEHREGGVRDVGAVIVAGGRSTGVDLSPDRSWLTLAGRSLAARALEPLLRLPSLARVAVVVEPADVPELQVVLAKELPRVVVQVVPAAGPPARSLHQALTTLLAPGDLEVVLVHDTAWALASRHLVHEVVDGARSYGAAAPCLARAPEIWLGPDGAATLAPLDRNDVLVQMPQGFHAADLLRHYDREEQLGYPAASPLEVYERHSGRRVRALPGESRNVRISCAEDVFVAEQLLTRSGFSSG
ncbi:MAG TPA: 2-C-methyl-D-erythritol 4-phosphate cytidylyltransferase [Actinomycetales bacterium]|nr:2-C-methyl-D-erythritol 4-phosphate cytidylyltransferase [Actinomycetales bacterium]